MNAYGMSPGGQWKRSKEACIALIGLLLRKF
jgi:hypothetical protein